MHQVARGLIIGSAIGGIVVAVGVFGCQIDTRKHVAEMLNISALPSSASEVECSGWGLTDVLERCSFRIDPAEFPSLLFGYQFIVPPVCPTTESDRSCVERLDAAKSHDYCCGPKLGSNFKIATAFYAHPSKFEHGGQVAVVTDASRRHVLVDRYIE